MLWRMFLVDKTSESAWCKAAYNYAAPFTVDPNLPLLPCLEARSSHLPSTCRIYHNFIVSKRSRLITAIAGLAWAWAKAPLRGEPPKEQASMSVRKGVGARTKKARLVVVQERESQLRLAQSRQVELYHAGPESWESFQVDSKAMPHTKPRPKLRA
jgi:hypothetical protein